MTPSRPAQLRPLHTGLNRALAVAPLISRFLLGLLGLFVVYVTMSLALVAVAPALGLGWTSVVITSGSMSPLISAGDIVLASPNDGQGLGPGTVVVFTDPARPGLLTHRIESVNPDGSYVTSGDANRQPDSTPLQPEQVVGVGRLLVPLIGLPLVWYWAGAWGNLGLWAAGTMLALWLTRFVLLERYTPQAQPEEPDHPGPVAPSDEVAQQAKLLPSAPKPSPDLGIDDTPIEGSGGEGPTTRDVVLAFSEPDSPPMSETTVSRPSKGSGRVSARAVAAEIETEGAASSFSPVVDEPGPLPGPQRTDPANISTSWAETSRMTTFENEAVNASRLLGVRQALGRRHDTKIPLEALVVMAVIPAWRTFPEFNATLDSDELIAPGASDVGIAVDTPDGLLVAMIRDAAAMGVMELASEVLRLGEDAKVQSPTPTKLTGQIFTVADAGIVDNSHSISIISPGTIGILSVGRIQQKSITIDGELVVEPMMPLSLSYDHRAINEGLARRFMVHVAENLKEPALFLAS